MISALFIALFLMATPAPSPAPEETAAALYRDVSGMLAEGDMRRARGDAKSFQEKYRLAAYLLEKIAQDFPDWNRQTVAAELERVKSTLASPPPLATPLPGSPVECFWQELLPGPKFEPSPGEAFEIAIGGDTPRSLVLSYRRRAEPAPGARICVQLKNTPRAAVLQDTLNTGLFQEGEGEFPLALYVPSGSLLYLGEYTENLSAPPRVLSNILTLP
jgi:hypothetical protein